MIEDGTHLVGDELDAAAATALSEYDLHIHGVKDCYQKFLYEVEVDKPIDEMEQDLLKMVQIKIKVPMRPPRIIILVPPAVAVRPRLEVSQEGTESCMYQLWIW